MDEKTWKRIQNVIEEIQTRGNDAIVRKGADGEQKVFEVQMRLRTKKRDGGIKIGGQADVQME